MTDRTIISQNLLELRSAIGLTQIELADKLHVSHQAISQWERSETLPDILTLPDLADIFGVSVDRILGRTEPVENPTVSNIPNTTTISLGEAASNSDYTVTIYKDDEMLQSVPTNLQDRLIFVLEGKCRELTTCCSAEIHGDVNGDVTVSGGLQVGSDICGDVTASGGVTIQGDIEGDVTLSGTCTITGDIEGDVNTDHDLTINGNVEGDISTSSNSHVDIRGDVDGDVDCGPLSVGGDIHGDVDSGPLTVDGDIDGDVDCGPLTIQGDINGDVDSGTLNITGNIVGNVDCTDCHITGSVQGDMLQDEDILDDDIDDEDE